MKNTRSGFTLIELLIVIAIIGILAAVLIPNLLNARQRAFDTAAQTCLKEIATAEEIAASLDPWEYLDNLDGSTINSCTNVNVTPGGVGGAAFSYTAIHANGVTTFEIANGTGVTIVVP